MPSSYAYPFPHTLRISHLVELCSESLQGSTKRARNPALPSFEQKEHRIEDKYGRNCCWANSNSSRSRGPDSSQGHLQGRESQLSYLRVFFSSSLAMPCLFCCFENGMGRNCLTLGPGCFRKAPVLLANMSSLWGSGNFTLFSFPLLCCWGISSCSWISSRVTVLLRETSDTVPWQRSLAQPKASGCSGKVGYCYSKHSCRVTDNQASLATVQGVRPRRNYVERHTYTADMLKVGDYIKMYAINYSLGSCHRSLDKETQIAKEIPPKRWKTVFMLNSN